MVAAFSVLSVLAFSVDAGVTGALAAALVDVAVDGVAVVGVDDAAKAPVTPASTENAKTEKAATTTASEEKNIYFLQAGAFREIADADAAKGRLALLGVAAAVSERRTETGTLYRVRVGPFKDTDTMHKMRTRLYDNGVDAAVVSVPK